MDKYEFNIKAEQMKKLASKGDYETAMRIADTIDWRRVRNTNLLSLVSQIYEKNEDYREAKDILLLAFERAPVGKRLLYKLSELSLKEHNVEEAEEFYNEFCDLAPEDPRQHLLRYMILKERRSPLDQLIHSLERYTALELDERWLYELAELYHKAGMDSDCVRVCDKIMLMFGLGKYVEKAMDLKIQHAPLTSYQMDLVENRDKYEARLRAVEQGFSESAAAVESPSMAEAGGYGMPASPAEPVPMGLGDAALADLLEEEHIPVASAASMPALQAEPDQGRRPEREPSSSPAPVPSYAQGYPSLQPQAAPVFQEPSVPQAVADFARTGTESGTFPASLLNPASAAAWPDTAAQDRYAKPDEDLIATVKVAEEEERLAKELSGMEQDREPDTEADAFDKTRILHSIKEVISPRGSAEAVSVPVSEPPVFSPALTEVVPEESATEPAKEPAPTVSVELEPKEGTAGEGPRQEPIHEEPVTSSAKNGKGPETQSGDNHLMIESPSPAAGLDLALRTLKQIHRETGSHNSVAKISAQKLNRKGLLTVSQQLEGKDLVVEGAGDLSEVLATELEHWMGMEKGGRVVVLIDSPLQMEKLHGRYPSLAAHFECIGDAPGEAGEAEERKPSKAKREIKPSKLIPTTLEQMIPEEPLAAPEKPSKAAKRRPEPETEPVCEEPEDTNSYEEEPKLPLEEPDLEPEPEHGLEPEPDLEPESEPEIPEEQMDIDEFAQYACKYAKEIDCSITGKSMLALYERIEIMEEEGVPLTASNAEELIEEAADRAEKPSLLRLITGMFTPKYDKDDYLILREEHFI